MIRFYSRTKAEFLFEFQRGDKTKESLIAPGFIVD